MTIPAAEVEGILSAGGFQTARRSGFGIAYSHAINDEWRIQAFGGFEATDLLHPANADQTALRVQEPCTKTVIRFKN